MDITQDKAQLKVLYLPDTQAFSMIEVPTLQFVMIDGCGDPKEASYAQAVKWLFAATHPIKQLAKTRMGKHFTEAPLEALYWCGENETSPQWRVMIVVSDWVDQALLAEAVAQASQHLGPAPTSLRLESYTEGLCVQIMRLGPYSEQTALLNRLHQDFLPKQQLKPHGKYHEIYLNDPNRVAPKKLRTVLRQPVIAV